MSWPEQWSFLSSPLYDYNMTFNGRKLVLKNGILALALPSRKLSINTFPPGLELHCDLIYFQMSIWWSGVRWWRRWLAGPALTVIITQRTILTCTNTLSLAMSSTLATIVISASNFAPLEIPSETTKLVFIKIKQPTAWKWYRVLYRAPRGRNRKPWWTCAFQDDRPWHRSRLPMQWLPVQFHWEWQYATPYWVHTFRFELSMQFVYEISEVLQVLVHAYAKSSQKLINHYKHIDCFNKVFSISVD